MRRLQPALDSPTDSTTGSPRNLLGFVDGTANLRTDDELAGRATCGPPAANGEPAWTAGGSYQVVRHHPDDRRVLGPHAARGAGGPDRPPQGHGAPLDGVHETDVPDFAADPDGEVTPLDAHIRLANPRTPATRGAT